MASRPALTFAPMVSSDLPEVVAIEVRSFPSPWRIGLFQHELGLEFSRLETARESSSGPILGYACWWVVAGEGHLLNLAVDVPARGRGVGRALVERIAGDCRAAGAGVVGLEVRSENGAAIALYQRCGFAEVGRRRGYYGPGRDAILMDLDLVAGADERGNGGRPS